MATWNKGKTSYPVVNGKKKCGSCNQWKNLEHFYKNRKSSGGVMNICKRCMYKSRRARWELVLENARRYRRTPTGHYSQLKSSNKFRSKLKKGGNGYKYKVCFTKDEFVDWWGKQSKRCYYCDMPEELIDSIEEIGGRKYAGGKELHRFTIDRKDNDRPYVLDNIVKACHICNEVKSTVFGAEEFRRLAQEFIKPKWEAFVGNTK